MPQKVPICSSGLVYDHLPYRHVYVHVTGLFTSVWPSKADGYPLILNDDFCILQTSICSLQSMKKLYQKDSDT